MLAKSSVLVVVPAFNEESAIGAVLEKLRETNQTVLVVSDGSTDSTARIAREFGVQLLDLPYNLGVGGALRAGFKYAVAYNYKAVVQIDADGQHPVIAIDQLIAAANSDQSHMVVGSRFLSSSTTMTISTNRRLIMKLLARSASRATNTEITDATSGYRIISQPLLGEFALRFADGYLGDTYGALISAGRAGYRVSEIPVGLSSRTHGESSANTKQAVSSILKVLGTALLHLHLRIRPFSELPPKSVS
jgi:glycosyltransferase involved in cell wall biosynthesis